jgi:stage V sporulation protein G
MFVAMPTRKIGEGVYLDIAFPIDDETRKWIEDTVLSAYAKLVRGGIQEHQEPKH